MLNFLTEKYHNAIKNIQYSYSESHCIVLNKHCCKHCNVVNKKCNCLFIVF